MIKSGKTSINPLAWIGKTKEEFFVAITGNVAHDKEDLWKQVQLINGDNEHNTTTSKQSKKTDKG